MGFNNIFSLFNGYNYENRIFHKKFLRFQQKDIQPESVNESRLPSLLTRQMTFAALKRDNLLDFVPYMMNVMVQFVVGSTILHSVETKHTLVDNNQTFHEKINWNNIAKMPL